MTREQEERLEEIKDFIYEARMLGITSNDVQFVVNCEFLLNLIEEQCNRIAELENALVDEKMKH